MPTLDQLFPSPAAGTLQSVSLVFTAGQLALGALRPPFRTQVGPDPSAPIPGLDVVTFDATLSETQTFASEVTEHPVEEGADITDHVRPKPIELRIQGIITETPIDDSLVNAAIRAAPALGVVVAGAASIQALLNNSGVVRTAFNSLRAIRDSGQAIAVSTKYRSYKSMVITELTFTRDPRTGDALMVSLALREVLTVASAVTTIQLPAMAQADNNMGMQPTKDAGAGLKAQTDPLLAGFDPKATAAYYKTLNAQVVEGNPAFKFGF